MFGHVSRFCLFVRAIVILLGSRFGWQLLADAHFGAYCASAFGFYTVWSVRLRFGGSILGLLLGLASLLFILALFVKDIALLRVHPAVTRLTVYRRP